MNDTMRKIVRTGLQGAVTAALLILGNNAFDVNSVSDVAWWKNLGAAIAIGAVTAIVAAVHNLVLDPSRIPSLAYPAPAPPVDVPAGK